MNPALLALLKHVPNKPSSEAHIQLKAESLALQVFRKIIDNPLEPQSIEVWDSHAGPATAGALSPLTIALVDLLRRALEPKGHKVDARWQNLPLTDEPNARSINKEVVTVK